MANVVKQGVHKRLPRITNGLLSTGECHVEGTLLYTVGVWGLDPDQKHIEYQVQFTEAEMVRICGQWLTMKARRL